MVPILNLPGMYGITVLANEKIGTLVAPWDVWNNDVAMNLIKKYLPCYNLEGIDYCQILHVLDYVEIGGDYDHNMHEFCYQMSANPFYSIFDMVYLGYKSLSSQSVHELVLKSV